MRMTYFRDSRLRIWLDGVWILCIRGGGAALALAAQILASRMLGAEEFGRYSLLLVWLLVLGYAATAGTGQLLCRFVSQYAKANDYERMSGLLRAVFLSTTLLALLIAAASIVGAFWWGIEEDHALLASLALSAIPLVTLQDNLESISRGLDRPALGIGPSFLLRHLAIILGLLSLVVLGREASATLVMAFTIVGLGLSVLCQYLLLRRHLTSAKAAERRHYDLYLWLRTALPMAGADVTEMLLFNADVIILGLFVSPEEVAFYFAATRLAQALGYIPYGATAVTAQKYAALAGAGDRALLQVLVGRVVTVSTLITALAAGLLAIFAAPLLSLFGAEFSEASPIVMLLGLGVLLSVALGPGDDVLNMLGQERICSLGFLLALVTNIALNFALIPVFGLLGAATATVSSLVARGAFLAYFAFERLEITVPAFISLLPSVRHEEAAHEA